MRGAIPPHSHKPSWRGTYLSTGTTLLYLLVIPLSITIFRPTDTPNIPSSKSHVFFLLLRSCQRISPGPRHFAIFRNKLNSWGFSPTHNPQAGGPLLVGYPREFIQYIRSYPPYLEAFPPSAT